MLQGRLIQRTAAGDPYEDSVPIDFTAAGLYLVGIQTGAAVLAAALCSLVFGSVFAYGPGAAVRTVSVSAGVGAAAVSRPLKVGRVRGVLLVFNALKPSVFVYVMSLVCEQLAHSCSGVPTGGSARRVLFHCASALMLASGLARARAPTSDSDISFLATVGLLVLASLVAPPPAESSGPFCNSALGMFSSIEKLLRAGLFSFLYSAFVYTAPPARNTAGDVAVSAARAAAATLWVLCVHPLLLVGSVAQGMLLVSNSQLMGEYTSVHEDESEGSVDEEEARPPVKNGAMTAEKLAEIAARMQ
jgi:hypothetical protein